MGIKLSVIIVNYNGGEILKNCLVSVFANLKNVGYEVIVSDNGSIDGSLEMAGKEFPAARLVRNGKNIGFAAANNRAAKIARGKYLFLLNPDTVVLDENVCKLVEFMDRHQGAGACGPLVLNADGTMQRQCKRGFPTFKNSFFYGSGLWKMFSRSPKWKKIAGGYFQIDKADDAACEVDQLSGAAMLVRRAVWKSEGGMNENYVMYWDDTDLCFRIKEKGLKIYYVPFCKITHYGGAGGAQLHAFRNLWHFHRGACVFYCSRLASKSNFAANGLFYFGIWLGFANKAVLNFFREEKIIGSKKPQK